MYLGEEIKEKMVKVVRTLEATNTTSLGAFLISFGGERIGSMTPMRTWTKMSRMNSSTRAGSLSLKIT